MPDFNRTEVSQLFDKWKLLPINDTELSAIGRLCQRVSAKARRDLQGRIKEEVEKACIYTSQHGFGQTSTALSIFSPLQNEVIAYLKPRQSSLSSQSGYSEIATLLCAIYFAIQLRKALRQRRPEDLISAEQAKTITLPSAPGTTWSSLPKKVLARITPYWIGCRKPEIQPNMPHKGSLSKGKSTLSTSPSSKETPAMKRKSSPELDEDLPPRKIPRLKGSSAAEEPEKSLLLSPSSNEVPAKRRKSSPEPGKIGRSPKKTEAEEVLNELGTKKAAPKGPPLEEPDSLESF